MAYDKQTWENTPSTNTPLSASRLNHMEDGIEAAHQAADSKPRILVFDNDSGWPDRPDDDVPTIFIGGTAPDDAPDDEHIRDVDVWIPSPTLPEPPESVSHFVLTGGATVASGEYSMALAEGALDGHDAYVGQVGPGGSRTEWSIILEVTAEADYPYFIHTFGYNESGGGIWYNIDANGRPGPWPNDQFGTEALVAGSNTVAYCFQGPDVCRVYVNGVLSGVFVVAEGSAVDWDEDTTILYENTATGEQVNQVWFFDKTLSQGDITAFLVALNEGS